MEELNLGEIDASLASFDKEERRRLAPPELHPAFERISGRRPEMTPKELTEIYLPTPPQPQLLQACADSSATPPLRSRGGIRTFIRRLLGRPHGH